MLPNGTISYAGTSPFVNAGGTKSAGNINITATTNTSMAVSCSTSATLAQSVAGHTIAHPHTVADESNINTTHTCSGVGTTVLTFTYIVGSDDSIFIGGRLYGGITTGFIAGSYSTNNTGTGGTNITVDVAYQ